MATELEWAWAAGLFEGEGSIRYYRDRFTLKLGMTDFDVVQRFHEVAGFGTIRETKKAEPHHLPFFEWSCTKQGDCREIMIHLWPLLGKRRRFRWNQVLELREKAFAPKICPECKKEFKPIRKAQVCCGATCSMKHTKKVGKYTDRKPSKKILKNGYSSKWAESLSKPKVPKEENHG